MQLVSRQDLRHRKEIILVRLDRRLRLHGVEEEQSVLTVGGQDMRRRRVGNSSVFPIGGQRGIKEEIEVVVDEVEVVDVVKHDQTQCRRSLVLVVYR